MAGMFPSWALPLWIIGAPAILVIINYLSSRNDGSEALRNQDAATSYGSGPSLATR